MQEIFRVGRTAQIHRLELKKILKLHDPFFHYAREEM